ncbi:hypothetical protein RJT34_25699 [Clitoria ternatea]|uniref:Uncharacterized protein n=1 Tax=Clitoria ternatea TaxID=43366 RepID=A0AAN9FQB6_CLITE
MASVSLLSQVALSPFPVVALPLSQTVVVPPAAAEPLPRRLKEGLIGFPLKGSFWSAFSRIPSGCQNDIDVDSPVPWRIPHSQFQTGKRIAIYWCFMLLV